MKKYVSFFILLLVFGFILMFVISCEDPSNSDSESDSESELAPPEMIKGTVAFGTSSGTLELGFASESRAIYDATGTIVHNGTSYNLTGRYESDTHTIHASSETISTVDFEIMGIYSEDGFVGAVERSVDGTVEETGSAVAVSCTAADVLTALNYLGTVGTGVNNSGAGTWNMTAYNGTIEGTYNYSGAVYGRVTGTLSSFSIIEYEYDNGITYELTIGSGSGTLSGDDVNGSWSAGGDSGLWTGTKQ